MKVTILSFSHKRGLPEDTTARSVYFAERMAERPAGIDGAEVAPAHSVMRQ